MQKMSIVLAIAAFVLAIIAVALSAAAFVRAGHASNQFVGGHAKLIASPDGAPSLVSLVFSDSAGNPRLELGLFENGTPFFDMRAPDGSRSLLSMSTNLRGGAPAISMRHPDHPATGWAVTVDDQGVAHVMQRVEVDSTAPAP